MSVLTVLQQKNSDHFPTNIVEIAGFQGFVLTVLSLFDSDEGIFWSFYALLVGWR